jgi:hypothetical protein
MLPSGDDRICPYCSAPSLIWVCKLLRRQRPAAFVWFCHCCKSVIDGSESVAEFRTVEGKQTSDDAETSCTFEYSSRLLAWRRN